MHGEDEKYYQILVKKKKRMEEYLIKGLAVPLVTVKYPTVSTN
jgi:hypothetical protein